MEKYREWERIEEKLVRHVMDSGGIPASSLLEWCQSNSNIDRHGANELIDHLKKIGRLKSKHRRSLNVIQLRSLDKKYGDEWNVLFDLEKG